MIALLAVGLPGCQSTTRPPDAVRDLLIDRIGWQPAPAIGDAAGQGVAHRFAITNTSTHDSYRQIRLCVDYYTRAGRRLGSDTTVVDTLLAPGTLIKFTGLRIGRLRPETDRTDIRVLGAVTN